MDTTDSVNAKLSDDRLDALEKRAEALRESAPWSYMMGMVQSRGKMVGGCQMNPGGYRVADIRGHGHLSYREDGQYIQTTTGEFIAAADPATVLALIAEIRRLRAQVKP